MKRTHFTLITATFLTALAITGCQKKETKATDAPTVLRVGFFPNITHAQGLIGYHDTATKGADGWFEKAVGTKIEWYPFNAGPSAIEALLAGSIDATYVGPNPALNGYTRTKGSDVRVLTGAARGGSALVIQPGSDLKTPADFRGKKIATPQLGNTQDVAARAWLKTGGLNITASGGDAFVVPTQNPDQLDLFKRKDLAAVWTVEPWVSRLEIEASAQLLIEQKDLLTTLFVASTKALETKRDLLKKFVVAHHTLTAKISAEPDWTKPLVTAALAQATTKPIPAPLLDRAWPRLTFTTAATVEDFAKLQHDAKSVGLLPVEADLKDLFTQP